MTAVIIVTAAAVSVLVASSAADTKFGAKTRALAMCESAVECLRFADGDTEMLDRTMERAGFERKGEDDYAWEFGELETVSVKTKTDREKVEKLDAEGNPVLDGEGNPVTETVETEKYVVTYNDEIIYEIEKIEDDE